MIFGAQSLYDTVFGGELPEHAAVIDGERSWTYPQLAELIDDCAANLADQGVRPHQVVGIQLGNGVDFVVAFHAIARLGAVVAPVGTHTPAADRDAMLHSADAKRLLTTNDMARLTRSRGARVVPAVTIDSEQLACLPFSSGTTGTPKAVMLPHRALAANIEQFAAVLPLRAGETCLSVLPYSHIYGLTATLNVPLALRATVITADFARESFIKAHERHDVNLTFIAPPLATLLAGDPLVTETNFSVLHTIISGAAPLNIDIAARAEARVNARIRQGFGLTEAAPVTHLAWQDDVAADSIGHPLPGTEIEIRDPHGRPATVGEMWVRGPQVMRGYLGDPLATEAALVDGWLRTGDLVERRSDGSYVVLDRLKDVIKSHGFQVSPVKLERLLAKHPAVTDVAVTRGFSSAGEERPEAYVVAHSSLEPQELIDWLAPQVAKYEKVRDVHLVTHIPRSAAGKILRRELRPLA